MISRPSTIEGDNPIHLAIVRHCHADLIDCFITHAHQCGNAIHEVNKNGYSPSDESGARHKAMISVNTEAVKVLTSLGADLSIALGIAHAKESALAIDRLLLLGADPDDALTHIVPEEKQPFST